MSSIDLRPIGIQAGDNKHKTMLCPGCHRGPSTNPMPNYIEGYFMFENGYSSMKYRATGLCQDCQNNIGIV